MRQNRQFTLFRCFTSPFTDPAARLKERFKGRLKGKFKAGFKGRCRQKVALLPKLSSVRALPAFCLILLLPLLVLLPAAAADAQECGATGANELSQADVYQQRMALKNEAGSFSFSSGAMEAAKTCADLINRISSLGIGSQSIPGMEEILAAVKKQGEEAVQDAEEEACRYVAQTGTSWVSAQIWTIKTAASRKADELAGTHVNVTNPNLRSLSAAYRSRLMGGLPRYSDLPGL